MDMIAQAGAIAPLVNLLSPPDDRGLQLVKKTKTKRKGAALPPAIELGMQNAAGALRHLSFHDPCIKPIVEAKAIQVRHSKV